MPFYLEMSQSINSTTIYIYIYIFLNFFMFCQMLKYFGKIFRLRCPSFLLSKFASQLKLIQSVVRVSC